MGTDHQGFRMQYLYPPFPLFVQARICVYYTVMVAREMLVEVAWCAEAIAILACLGPFL